MASDKMLGSFDQKSAPEDNDLLVEYDAAASKVKNVKFGGVWNWIVKKLTSAVINELQTSSKNVVGAINELNSKTYINSTSADSFSFKIGDISKEIYVSIIMYGSTSAKNVFFYNVFIDVADNGRKVTFIKIIDALTSRTFSGSYNDSTNTLLITANCTVWAGIRLIVIK